MVTYSVQQNVPTLQPTNNHHRKKDGTLVLFKGEKETIRSIDQSFRNSRPIGTGSPFDYNKILRVIPFVQNKTPTFFFHREGPLYQPKILWFSTLTEVHVLEPTPDRGQEVISWFMVPKTSSRF